MFLVQTLCLQSLLLCSKALLSLSRQGLFGAALALEQDFVTRLNLWGPCHVPSLQEQLQEQLAMNQYYNAVSAALEPLHHLKI